MSLGDCVCVVGGKGVGDKVLSTVGCLNVRRWQWSAMTEVPHAVSVPALATHGNRVFVFGGKDEQGVDLCCTQVLDTTRGQWSTGSDSPELCDIGAAVT